MTRKTIVPSPPTDPGLAPKESLSAKFARWMALYAAFLFLAGWTYLKTYFGVYGLNTGWLDFGFHDTVVHGFSILFGTGAILSIAYLLVLLVSLLAEIFYSTRSQLFDAGLVLAVAAFFPVTYEVASRAGVTQANVDRGDRSLLPTVTFNASGCDYRGKLIYVKSESLYIYKLAYLPRASSSKACPFDLTDAPSNDLTGTSSSVPQLWLVRLGDLKDVRVTHYQQEAKR